MKAMILAAGRGERMRPLTEHTPKPLLRVGECSMLERHLRRLKQAGFEEVVINIAYQAKKITDYIGDGERFGLKLTYSWEGDAPLGTAAGIARVLPLLGDGPFFLISADVVTDYPLLQLPSQLMGVDAHLILVQNPSYHREGDFALTADGLLSTTSKPYTYGSFGVFHSRFFAHYDQNVVALGSMLFAAADQHRLSGEVYSGLWFNVGTPDELSRAAIAIG